jgi:hypothetical protein
MSAIIVALIMFGVGAVCLKRAAAADWRERIKDEKSFLLFCGIFGAGGVALAFASRHEPFVSMVRLADGALLLGTAALVLWRRR